MIVARGQWQRRSVSTSLGAPKPHNPLKPVCAYNTFTWTSKVGKHVAQSPQRDSQRPLLCTPWVQVARFRGMLRPIERPAQCTAFLIQGPLPAVFCLQLALLQSCSPEPQQSALTAVLSVACQPAASLGQAAFSRSQLVSACSTCLPAPVRMTTS